MKTEIKETVLQFCQKINNDPHHRYRSWEHCYQFFHKWQHPSRLSGDVIDLLALHLAFYLASWGMYRGSSKLLWKDYKVHIPVVTELNNEQYNPLWQTDGLIKSRQSYVDLLFELVERLRTIYRQHGVTPTDTLISKTLLGTMGCVPAYDRLVKMGIKRWNEQTAQTRFPVRFGKNSVQGIQLFCYQNATVLNETQKAVNTMRGCHYPIMKLADMYFWQVGWE
ncbi:MAG: hypothetical protein DHS20C20_18730 [Ardenticatenaceae bacterium]|nr:MAG: hypothetical protein DHS20C20_18730 [Ardenticatenaceae bacterium]